MRFRPTTLCFVLILTSCGRETIAPRNFPNAPVILISIDTLRADRLPIYGYDKVETPHIDALAKEAVIFERAWSHCPMTLPSHVSMLTGLLPTSNGVRNNVGFRYDAAKFPSLPQALKQRGYATGAAVSSYVLRGETGMSDAFDTYDDAVDPRPGATFVEYQRDGATTAAIGSKWLESIARKPFFFMLHLYEPHVPYSPPEPYRSRYPHAYDGEVAASDAIVGTFLDGLKARGIYDDAIIILTSDHGEGLGDHGEAQHSTLLYAEAIRVPLIIKLPKSARGGTRVGGNAALVDLVPTLAALLGMSPSKSDGIDLFAGKLPEREIYSETIYPYVQLGWSDLRSLVLNQHHYIHSPRPELYDVVGDPLEKNDIIANERRIAARLRTSIAKFPEPTAGSQAVDAETLAKLAALGYVGSVRPQGDPATLPNPRDHIAEVEQIRDAFHLANQNRFPEAIASMKQILAKNPKFIDVWIRLAEVNQTVGRAGEAVEAYKQAIGAAGPALSSDILISLATLYLQIDKLDDAEKTAEAALAGSPDKAKRLLVRIAGSRGDLRRAERIARELMGRSNASAADFLLLAEVLKARGDLPGALKNIDESAMRARAAGSPNGVYGLEALRAEVLVAMDRHADAVRAYESEIARFPNNLTAYSRLAVLYFVMGDRVAVDRTLESLVAANPAPPSYALAERTLLAVEDVRGAQRWRERMPR